MDASQYKDYVLVPALHQVRPRQAPRPALRANHDPRGARFKDMVALKDKSDIGHQINMKITATLASATTIYDPACDSGSLLLQVAVQTQTQDGSTLEN